MIILDKFSFSGKRTDFIEVLFEKFQSKDKYDIILANHVMEHVSEPLETLKNLCSRSLKQGGIVRLNVPNGWDIKNRLKIQDWNAEKGSSNSLTPVAPLEHINCFNYKSLTALGKNAGLEPVIIDQKIPFTMKGKIKSFVKPYYIRLTKRKSTLLYFRKPY